MVAATDPDRADRLTADAERIAQSIAKEGPKALALVRITESVVATDPDHAEGIARSIIQEDRKEFALSCVARAFIATDPDRAERITRSITDDDGYMKASSLVRVAQKMAATDPSGAASGAARLVADAERIGEVN